MKKYLLTPFSKNTISKLIYILTLSCLSCTAQKAISTTSLFNGESLDGWKVVKQPNARFWSVKNGVITGGDSDEKIPTNTYLHSTQSYENFEFRCLFKLTGNHDSGLINSGIQYRSTIQDNKIIGYQADIGKGYWGDIYDEHRRGKLIDGDLSTLKYILKEDGWNSYIVRCIGNKHELYINGVKTSEYIETDNDIPSKGVIGIQLHKGGNAKIEFKNITITEL